MPTTTTITSVRAAKWDEFLAPEADASAATVTGGHINGGLIDEFHGNGFLWIGISAGLSQGLKPWMTEGVRELGAG